MWSCIVCKSSSRCWFPRRKRMLRSMLRGPCIWVKVWSWHIIAGWWTLRRSGIIHSGRNSKAMERGRRRHRIALGVRWEWNISTASTWTRSARLNLRNLWILNILVKRRFIRRQSWCTSLFPSRLLAQYCKAMSFFNVASPCNVLSSIPLYWQKNIMSLGEFIIFNNMNVFGKI